MSDISESIKDAVISVLPIKQNWPETFQIPWEKMPPSIRTATESGKRPSPADRRQMVWVLVDEMKKYEANPSWSQCLIISVKIVNEFPQSFADMIEGKFIGGGYASLLSQIKIHVEHLNRNNTLARRRSVTTGAKQNTGPADSYSCTRWQPDLPPEETESTLEEKKKILLEFFSREGLSGIERGEVQNLMEATYYLQRKMINTTPAHTLEYLKSQWPYLFVPRSMCRHFEMLTDINILRKLEASLEGNGEGNIMEFLKKNPTNSEVKAVLTRSNTSVAAPYVLLVLMAHFKE
ncbi:uncharacterized protein LOC118213074 [Anguilla anguilla]|uniref:uncharacterized protein LOC118213074 n=1 Tax=Anguilla anguilla TaxID=7936 RepID=UPI0015ACCD61|nr:uncharacterized protein LOC118213074 [Anguilla anguilla]